MHGDGTKTVDELIKNSVSKIDFKNIDIDENIFDNDALIFNPNPFSKVTFVHVPSQKEYLSVTFKNYPYLGIWSSNKDAPFVCIEPWHGITDHKGHNKNLSQKEGILKLLPNEIFNCEFMIEVD